MAAPLRASRPHATDAGGALSALGGPRAVSPFTADLLGRRGLSLAPCEGAVGSSPAVSSLVTHQGSRAPRLLYENVPDRRFLRPGRRHSCFRSERCECCGPEPAHRVLVRFRRRRRPSRRRAGAGPRKPSPGATGPHPAPTRSRQLTESQRDRDGPGRVGHAGDSLPAPQTPRLACACGM